MLQYSLPVIIMCILDTIVFFALIKTTFKGFVDHKNKRARSNRFKSYKSYKEFKAQQEAERKKRIESEIQGILNDSADQKVNYSI